MGESIARRMMREMSEMQFDFAFVHETCWWRESNPAPVNSWTHCHSPLVVSRQQNGSDVTHCSKMPTLHAHITFFGLLISHIRGHIRVASKQQHQMQP
jgi:hypothetical protein